MLLYRADNADKKKHREKCFVLIINYMYVIQDYLKKNSGEKVYFPHMRGTDGPMFCLMSKWNQRYNVYLCRQLYVACKPADCDYINLRYTICHNIKQLLARSTRRKKNTFHLQASCCRYRQPIFQVRTSCAVRWSILQNAMVKYLQLHFTVKFIFDFCP